MLSALTSLYRPAESHTIYPSHAVRSGAPRWCHQLIEAQENGRCISPFTNIPASLRVPLHLHRDAYLAEVQRASAPQTNLTWMSGQGQDWWVWYNHARFLNRSATYVDLAANDAIWRSNTYFFDACLHWQGLLIEPNPEHYARLRRERSGTLVPSCVSNSSSNVSFHQGLGWRGGSSKILPGAARPEGHGVRTVQCRSLQSIILEGGHRHIDFLSLDVEGHEVQALSSVDLSKVHIDIIISENPRVAELLLRNGYRLQSSAHDNIWLRSKFEPAITRHGGKVTDRTSNALEYSCG